MKKGYFILIALMFFFHISRAQLSKEEIINYLTNGDDRTWIFKNYRLTLGSCSGDGQSFNFYKTGKLAWRRCINDSVAYQRIQWSIKAVPNSLGDYAITFIPPIEIQPVVKIETMWIELVLPKVHTRNTKMIWNWPGRQSRPEPKITLASED